MLSRMQESRVIENPWLGIGVVLALSLGTGGCKRDRSDTPAPDPLTAPTQSAPSTTELAPVGQATDVPAPTASAAPPPPNQGSGSGTKTGSGSSKKKEDDKKEDDKSEDKSCFAKCQSAFMTCMTPKSAGGGFPQPPDPEACRSALQSCQGACQ
jgi:hypothetical protein